jgi:glutaminase
MSSDLSGPDAALSERLQELYARQLLAGEEGVSGYYESGEGYVAPELAGDAREQFAISIAGLGGQIYRAGQDQLAFPLHSISKVFAYAQALEDHGRDAVLRRVGVEPSGDAYNSITFDEHNARPHNPMVNAGTLATSALVHGRNVDEKFERVLKLVRDLAGNEQLEVDEDVFPRSRPLRQQRARRQGVPGDLRAPRAARVRGP